MTPYSFKTFSENFAKPNNKVSQGLLEVIYQWREPTWEKSQRGEKPEQAADRKEYCFNPKANLIGSQGCLVSSHFSRPINSPYGLKWVEFDSCILQLNESDWYKSPSGLFRSWRSIEKREAIVSSSLSEGNINKERAYEYLHIWGDNGGLKVTVQWQRTGSPLSTTLQTGVACKMCLGNLDTCYWASGILKEAWLRRKVAPSCPAPPNPNVLKSKSPSKFGELKTLQKFLSTHSVWYWNWNLESDSVQLKITNSFSSLYTWVLCRKLVPTTYFFKNNAWLDFVKVKLNMCLFLTSSFNSSKMCFLGCPRGSGG